MADPNEDDLYMMRLAKRRATVLVREEGSDDMRPATLISWRYGRNKTRARVQFADGAVALINGKRIEVRAEP